MRSYLRSVCSCAMFLVASAACGQQVQGYTTLDIDPSTNAVTVTCETSIDNDYYASFVSCSVADGNGTQITSASRIDDYGYEGYAQVVLTFTGTAGTTYLATGVHSAQPTMPFDTPTPQPGRPANQLYDDPYNYNSFSQSGAQTYFGSFNFYGPGPDQQVKRRPIHIADTKASLLVPPMPDHLSVVSDTTQVLNCSIGTTELRAIQYNILDINQIMISRPISVFETVYPTNISTCNNVQAYTSLQCTPLQSDNFTDGFSAGCATTKKLANGCGWAIPDQKWEWCNPQATLPASIGDIGPDFIQNNYISIGGNATAFPAGQTFPK